MSDETEPSGDALEGEIRETAQANALKAGDLEKKLLERIQSKIETMDAKEMAQSLQAITNMKARNIEKLKSLAEKPAAEQDDMELIAGMVRKGYLRPTGQAAAAFGAETLEPTERATEDET